MENIKEIILNTFEGVNSLEELEKNIRNNSKLIPQDLQNKFKGDIFELFIKYFIESFSKDKDLQILNYTSGSPFGEDTGTDGYGIGPDNNISFCQVKYRSNKNDILNHDAHLENVINDKNIYYNNLLKNCTCENEYSKILKAKNEYFRIFYFTNTDVKFKYAHELLGDKYNRFIINRTKLKSKTDNNPSFWNDIVNFINNEDLSNFLINNDIDIIPENKTLFEYNVSNSEKIFDKNKIKTEFKNIFNSINSIDEFFNTITINSEKYESIEYNSSKEYLETMFFEFIRYFIYKTNYNNIYPGNFSSKDDFHFDEYSNTTIKTVFTNKEYLTSNTNKLTFFNIKTDVFLDNKLNGFENKDQRFDINKKIIFTNSYGIFSYSNEKMLRNEILCIGINELKKEINKFPNFFDKI